VQIASLPITKKKKKNKRKARIDQCAPSQTPQQNMKHLARTLTFEILYSKLQEEVDAKRVNEIKLGDLSLFTYSEQCVYDRLWNKYNTIARGLVLDVVNKEVVATPFPKFFNYGEEKVALPDEPFEAYEKYDGSLGIAFYYQDQWHVTRLGAGLGQDLDRVWI